MLTSIKQLLLLLAVLSIAGCAASKPIARSKSVTTVVTSTNPGMPPSEESIVVFSQPLAAEPPFPEPTLLP
jgi:predicted component of type VI protein secretion system